MTKTARKRINELAANADDRSPLNEVATLKDADIARRAFELYCERGGQHGHDVEDWCEQRPHFAQRARMPLHDCAARDTLEPLFW